MTHPIGRNRPSGWGEAVALTGRMQPSRGCECAGKLWASRVDEDFQKHEHVKGKSPDKQWEVCG